MIPRALTLFQNFLPHESIRCQDLIGLLWLHKGTKHHHQWVSSYCLRLQTEAIAEVHCSCLSFQGPEEEKGSFLIAGEDMKGQAVFSLRRGGTQR